LGSFPTAFLIVKKSTGKDIRKEESKNVGALNVMRVTGKPHLFPALGGKRPKWYWKKSKLT